MTGERKTGFHQRDRQNRNHRQRNHRKELAHHARHEKHRHEGEDGCGNRRENRRDNFDCAINRRLQWRLAHRAMRIDVFSDYDGVVDDYPQSNQERKQRKHVQRLVELEQHGTGTQKRNGDPHRHPECQLQVQKHGEDHKDQDQALHAVAEQQIESIADFHGRIAPDSKRVAWRKRFFPDVFADGIGHGKQVLAGRGAHINGKARTAVDAADRGGVDKLIPHLAKVPDLQHHTAGLCNQRNRGDFSSKHTLVTATQQVGFTFVTNGAAREFQVTLANAAGNVAERQAIFPQATFRDFHVNLVLAFAVDFRLRNFRDQQQVIANLFGDLTQLKFRFERGRVLLHNAHRDGLVTQRDLLHFRLFRQIRQTGNAINLRLDFVEHLLDAGHIAANFNHDAARAFGGD